MFWFCNPTEFGDLKMTFRYTIEDEKGVIKAGFGSLLLAKSYLKKLGDSRFYICKNHYSN